VFFFFCTFSWFDRLSLVDRMAVQYKPGPQACYLVGKMAESEKVLLKVVSKLSEKIDGYDKRFALLGSVISKVQSHMDLAMCSIQVL
jgi:hypothetical protein